MKVASQILSEALSERKASNPSYSLRAFARDIGLSAPQLSNVMNGHRGLSPEMAEKVAARLLLTPLEKDWFRESLRASFSPSKTQRLLAKKRLTEFESENQTKYLEMDLFRIVSNWYHFALVELIKISKKQKNPIPFFAKKLGISENEIMLALQRLKRIELITETKQGWNVNQDTVIADQGIPTDAVRNFHRQILEKSIQALALQKPEERYGYSGTLPVKVKSVARAKKLIQKFRSDFAKEISDHEDGEEIYGFSLQFFRLTQTLEENSK
jgi:uncharacterized protein (TIGR02147 family)